MSEWQASSEFQACTDSQRYAQDRFLMSRLRYTISSECSESQSLKRQRYVNAPLTSRCVHGWNSPQLGHRNNTLLIAVQPCTLLATETNPVGRCLIVHEMRRRRTPSLPNGWKGHDRLPGIALKRQSYSPVSYSNKYVVAALQNR